MPQQIHDGYRPVRRHKLQNVRSVGRNRTNADPHVGKSRNKFGYGIRKRELAGIDQHHRREASNGLRHRMESKNRIGSHRNIGHHVTDAETLQIDWVSVLLDQYDGTWQFPCGNLIVEKFGDALEFIRRRNVSAGSRAYVDLFGPNRYQNGCQHKSHGTRRRGKIECSMNRCRHDNCSFWSRWRSWFDWRVFNISRSSGKNANEHWLVYSAPLRSDVRCGSKADLQLHC